MPEQETSFTRAASATVGQPAAEGTGVPTEWWLDRDLAHQLYPLARRPYLSGEDLDRELESFAAIHGDAAYAELIFLLTSLKLDPVQAHDHWCNIRNHQRVLAGQFAQAPDVRVVLMSYFLDVHRRFERPKIVEMDWVERAAASAYLDVTTGLPNHRFLREQLDRELDRSLAENSPLSLIFIDADDFKRVNDAHGHESGNAALLALARLIRHAVPERASLARYGGEEFVVVVPATPKHEAAEIAERARAAVASESIAAAAGVAPLRLTVSIGVATCPADARTSDDLVQAADAALYLAKDAGKNRVALFGESTRSFPRHRVVWRGTVRELNAATPIQGVELGDGGLVFRSERALATDALIEVTVDVPDRDALVLAGRVVWSRPVAPGSWETALRVVEQGVTDRHRLAQWVGELRRTAVA